MVAYRVEKVIEKEKDRKISQNSKNHVWIKLALLIVILGGISVVLYETGAIQFFLSKKRILAFLDSLGPWGFVGFILLQSLQVVVAPIPGELTGLLGGFLYGPYLGIALSTVGLTLGSVAAFSLARIFGRPFVEKAVSPATFQRFDYLLHHKGAFLVFLLFLIPGFPKDYLCYLLGLGHLTTMEFIVIGGLGRLFGTVLLTLGGNYIKLHQYVRFGVLVGAALIIVFLAMVYRDKLEKVFRVWHERMTQNHTSADLNGACPRSDAVHSPKHNPPKA